MQFILLEGEEDEHRHTRLDDRGRPADKQREADMFHSSSAQDFAGLRILSHLWFSMVKVSLFSTRVAKARRARSLPFPSIRNPRSFGTTVI